MKITVKNLTKKFQGKVAVDDISFSINKGELVTIMGSSGSGKSVLIRCISGLLQPSSGKIIFDGKEVKGSSSPILARSGMVFQKGALFDSLPVWRNVAFSNLVHGIGTASEAKKRALEVLKEVDLDPSLANSSISELSGGMQQRVSIARTIFQKPDIMFFDEPTASLDIITGFQINNLILSTVKKHNATAVVISHSPEGIKLMNKRILVMEHGKLIYDGSFADMSKSKSPFIRDFIRIAQG